MRYMAWLLGGFALLGFSKVIEALGDSFPMAEEGVSGERLVFHSLALIVLVAGLFCFVRALRAIWLTIRSRGKPAAAAPGQPVRLTAPAAPQAPAEFDPDAALARYLKSKADQPGEPGAANIKPATSFGRRGL